MMLNKTFVLRRKLNYYLPYSKVYFLVIVPKPAAVNTPSAPMDQMLPYALVEAASKVIFKKV